MAQGFGVDIINKRPITKPAECFHQPDESKQDCTPEWGVVVGTISESISEFFVSISKGFCFVEVQNRLKWGFEKGRHGDG